jgi:hypothetical protein
MRPPHMRSSVVGKDSHSGAPVERPSLPSGFDLGCVHPGMLNQIAVDNSIIYYCSH